MYQDTESIADTANLSPYTTETGLEIAVIGMAGRFPHDGHGKGDLEGFWQNIKEGAGGISFFSNEELTQCDVEDTLLEDPNYVQAASVLEDIDCFDAAFFGYTHKEAELMDPQLRIFHECVWQALEDAAYEPLRYKGYIGLYAGASPNPNWQAVSLCSGNSQQLGAFAAAHLIQKDYLSLRIAYKLNLTGPAVAINTACSTSLVAIHMACQGILNGECDMALAGGVTVGFLNKSGYYYQEGMIGSPDGFCRPFDARAQGTVAGDGAGVVVLKRLIDARKDGDFIYAVVKGSAVNNDGIRKAGFTAPSVEGQAEAIRSAMQMAETAPESIGYIETHGTATHLGDPVEIEGLKLAFNSTKKNLCALGAVKANVGHLDCAAGVAGFIKTVLVLHHRFLPPMRHFKSPNPAIDLDNSPFYINTEGKQWLTEGVARRAGVSSFGIGGTNAHIVLEEDTARHPLEKSAAQHLLERDAAEEPGQATGSPHLFIWSTGCKKSLEEATSNLARFLKSNPDCNPADVAYTLQVGRRAFSHRRMMVCHSLSEATQLLSTSNSRKVYSYTGKKKSRPLVFMFPGLGSQYMNMGLELYQKEPLFRREMDRCFEVSATLTQIDYKAILYPADSIEDKRLHHAEIAQVVVFMFEYSLAKLLMAWGIQPEAMIGYSFGEYVAACISGVFTMEAALALVVERGRIVAKTEAGAMLSVPLEKEETENYLATIGDNVRDSGRSSRHPLALAIDNGPSCVVSGTPQAIDALESLLKKDRVMSTPVNASNALHSPMMEPVLNEFRDAVAKCRLNKPTIPFISNVTGTWNDGLVSPAYLADHLSRTVQFAAGVKELLKKKDAILIEVGPGRDMCNLLMRDIDQNSGQQTINIVRHAPQKVSDCAFLANRIGMMWLWGVEVDWAAFNHDRKGKRQPMPTYPFQPERYPIQWGHVKEAIEMMGAGSFNRPLTGEAAINPLDNEFLRQQQQQLSAGNDVKELADYPGLERAMDELSVSLICDYFSTAVPVVAGEVFGIDGLKTKLAVRECFDKFFGFFLQSLQEDGIISITGDEARWLPAVTRLGDSEELVAQMLELFPPISGTIRLMAYCAHHYAPALSGEIESISVLYPDGEYITADPQYVNTVEFGSPRIYNEMLYAYILKQLDTWPKGKTFRILEVGGGMGIFTTMLAPQLVGRNVSYHFSDIGNFFVLKAQQEAKRLGLEFMRFDVLDISKPPGEQGFEPGAYDLIIGMDVVHVVPSLTTSLNYLKQLLSPGGEIALVEAINPKRYINIIYGLAEGWWHYEEDYLRRGSPLMNLDRWEQLFTETGFPHVAGFPIDRKAREDFNFGLVLARQPENQTAVSDDQEEEKNSGYSRRELTSDYEAPTTETHRKLAVIWQEFLGVRQVGIKDDFFELGADSLILITIAARIQKQLDIRVAIPDFFKYPTIAELSPLIEQSVAEKYLTIQPVEPREHYPVTVSLKRIFSSREALEKTQSIYYNLPFVYIINGRLESERLQDACLKLIQLHEVLRTSFHMITEDRNSGIQIIHPHIDFKIDYFQCSETRVREKVAELIRPFILSQAPLFRIAVMEVEPEKFYLFFDSHHMISDYFSLDIMTRDFFTLYMGGTPTPPTVQFKDYAVWQDNVLSNGGLQRYEQYWLDKLKGIQPFRLPSDCGPSNSQREARSMSIHRDLKELSLQRFNRICSERKIMKSSLLTAIYLSLLSWESGEDDLVIAMRISDRHHEELKNTIGAFLNKIFFRTAIDSRGTFWNHLEQVNRLTMEVLEYSIYPYEILKKQVMAGNHMTDKTWLPVLINYLPYTQSTEDAQETNQSKESQESQQLPFQVQQMAMEKPGNQSRYDLSLLCREGENILTLELCYMDNLYTAPLMERFISGFEFILENISNNADLQMMPLRDQYLQRKQHSKDGYNPD
ncbi:MAG: acyltransferase domain-containing protein [bacterium]|nr:acyltransferase domain-containing protein [bacterium]